MMTALVVGGRRFWMAGTDLEANVSLADACRRLGLETLFGQLKAAA